MKLLGTFCLLLSLTTCLEALSAQKAHKKAAHWAAKAAILTKAEQLEGGFGNDGSSSSEEEEGKVGKGSWSLFKNVWGSKSKGDKDKELGVKALCHTVFDDVMEEKCITTYDDACETKDVPFCQTLQIKECTPDTMEKCQIVMDQKCATHPMPYCETIWEKKCKEVDVCTETKEKSCQTLSKKVCVTKIDRQCHRGSTEKSRESESEDSESTKSSEETKESSEETKESSEETKESSEETKNLPFFPRGAHHFKGDKNLFKGIKTFKGGKDLKLGKGFKAGKGSESTEESESGESRKSERCIDIPIEVCHEEPHEKCDFVPKKHCAKTEKCSNLPVKKCGLKEKTSCIPIPTKKCTHEPKTVCRHIPKEFCCNHQIRICRKIPQKSCSKTFVRRPRQVCSRPDSVKNLNTCDPRQYIPREDKDEESGSSSSSEERSDELAKGVENSQHDQLEHESWLMEFATDGNNFNLGKDFYHGKQKLGL